MTTAQTGTLVFKDSAGNYFLAPQETLERGRVPQEQRAELEQAIAAAQSGADGADVQGHLLPAVFGVGVAIGYFGTKAALEGSSGITTGQMIQGWVDQANGARGRSPA